MLRVIALLVFGALLCFAPRVSAQNPDTLMPDERAAKAKQILQQLIDALGGQAYLRVSESDCTGRLAQFAHTGDVSGYLDFHDWWIFPDRNRTEYQIKSHKVLDIYQGDFTRKGKVVDVFAGDKGWTLDKGGVQEQPAGALEDFKEQVKTDFDNLLRFRLKEEGLIFRYGGSDMVDLKMVDWIEIVDRDRYTYRIAVARSTHLPVRMVVIKRNEATRERTEELTYFADFHRVEGIETPLQISREVDGRRSFQVFYSECKFNTGLPEAMFTKASLEQRYSETAKKDKRNKNEKSDAKN
jgi:hypothetical protein